MWHFATVVPVLLAGLGVSAQTIRWSRTYDVNSDPNGSTSVVVLPNGGYASVFVRDGGAVGAGYQFCLLDSTGAVTISAPASIRPDVTYYLGFSGSVRQRENGLFLQGAVSVSNGESDGLLACYGTNGDTNWVREYGLAGSSDNLTAIDVIGDRGFALFGTVQTGQYYDMRLIRTDTMGNVLWSQTYGGPEDQQCVSGHRTLDGGYVLAGFKYFNNDHLNMYVVKTDSMGNQQWAQSYGSPWIDNTGFIRQLPDSGYILAGARRLNQTGLLFPCFCRIDPQGAVVWSSTLSTVIPGVLFADPLHVPGVGYVATGNRNLVGGQTIGRLTMVDLNGGLLWDHAFQTNSQADHYFYDVERTLDGGYIMAGTAFDSMLVSQDAWLVKVDSFGCLVPGCQVFDGLQEQFTDLVEVLTLYPNPVAAGAPLQVGIELPHGFNTTGELSLGLVSSDGRLVREQVLPNNATRAELPTTGLAPGLYFVHLRDGARWLCGGKVVVE